MKLTEQTQPARFDKAVIFCCDTNYLPFALFAARQIALLPGQRDYDICVVSSDAIAVPEPLQDLGLRLCRVDMEGKFADRAANGRLGYSTYLRLGLPEIFHATYRRILYLDSDIYVDGGDYSALLDCDLRGKPIGAVRDNIQWQRPDQIVADFETAGLPPGKYFNAGVLLLDTVACRECQLLETCLALSDDGHKVFEQNDQSLLNCALHGKWAELPPTWNWQWPIKRQFFEQIEGPNIVHFITGMKPWKGDWKGALPPRYRKAYARFLKAYFPHIEVVPPARNRLRESLSLLIILLRHAATRRKLLRYLDRFAHDLDIKT